MLRWKISLEREAGYWVGWADTRKEAAWRNWKGSWQIDMQQDWPRKPSANHMDIYPGRRGAMRDQTTTLEGFQGQHTCGFRKTCTDN